MDPYGRPPPPPFQSPRPPPPGQHFVQPPAGAPHPPPMSADYHAASPAAQGHDQFALSTAYDSVKRVMLNPYNNNRMEEKDLDDFKIILQMIMQDCSRTNIESGKTWVFKYCYEPQQIEVIADLWLALSQSRNSFLERLHLIYLVNDILFHSVRRQQMWMKEAILPRLVPLLRQAYHYSGISTDMKSKVTKVISIWSDKHFFDPNVLDSIRKNVVIPPPPPAPLTPYDVKPTPPPPGAVGPPLPPHPNMHPSMAPPMPPMPSPHFNPGFRPPFPPPPAGYPYPLRPHIRPPPMPPAGVMPPHPPPGMNPHLPPRPMMSMPRPPPPPPVIPAAPPHAYPPTTESQNPTQIEQTAPEKQYYELPAGLMLSAVQINDDTYSAIRPSEIQQVYSYPSPTDEMNRAVDDFYWGLDLRDRDNAEEFEEQADSKLDRSGWEPDGKEKNEKDDGEDNGDAVIVTKRNEEGMAVLPDQADVIIPAAEVEVAVITVVVAAVAATVLSVVVAPEEDIAVEVEDITGTIITAEAARLIVDLGVVTATNHRGPAPCPRTAADPNRVRTLVTDIDLARDHGRRHLHLV
ncbi:hypothetical protein BDB00DRAFT_789550 [Zychaea mexicana]|uniref:uncharacterized protein n=1 Tax=Zychaea mexicana TaxID=64656 RepID=UPI0022FDCF07|nr:uncharacterized protein BDB00DRAFT_789550 [Zychaea mexicana]KAI9491414.1 hypothetical protein BDB00DRAFT_789550 [Zychaea mexicana]